MPQASKKKDFFYILTRYFFSFNFIYFGLQLFCTFLLVSFAFYWNVILINTYASGQMHIDTPNFTTLLPALNYFVFFFFCIYIQCVVFIFVDLIVLLFDKYCAARGWFFSSAPAASKVEMELHWELALVAV